MPTGNVPGGGVGIESTLDLIEYAQVVPDFFEGGADFVAASCERDFDHAVAVPATVPGVPEWLDQQAHYV